MLYIIIIIIMSGGRGCQVGGDVRWEGMSDGRGCPVGGDVR